MATACRLQWVEYLHCPGCAKLGEITITQPGGGFGQLRGERNRVAGLSKGFRFDQSELGFEFYCVDCDKRIGPTRA
jgi:hypothetical protein